MSERWCASYEAGHAIKVRNDLVAANFAASTKARISSAAGTSSSGTSQQLPAMAPREVPQRPWSPRCSSMSSVRAPMALRGHQAPP